ncbi:MAG TPA: lipid II flippase MurJ, partial [Clostridia bacterium]|nr:lipid II flippase MurJ [Clostridia bacterium]
TFLHRLTSSYLQAKFRFGIPAVATLLYNVFVVTGIVLSGANIYVVAAATLLGTAVQFFVQLPQARHAGLEYRPVIDMKEPGLRAMMTMMIPVLIASGFDQLYMVFDQRVVSVVEGQISSLDYANRINTMVSAVLLITIATVLYPSLVRDAKDPKAYAKNLSLGFNLNLLIAIPAMAALVMLRVPIIRLVYERGSFTAANTLTTAGPLACYGLGLLGVGIREMCSRGFYARQEVKI